MESSFLKTIIDQKRIAVDDLKQATDMAELRKQAHESITSRRSLSHALKKTDRTNIIAEIKRASPSKGVINDHVDVSAKAHQYELGGAAAISVLTEEICFKGSLQDLRQVRAAVRLPVLRKDFIIDEFQVYEAAAAGADAILLIVAALDDALLRALFAIAVSDLEMDVLVEVHNETELAAAVRCGANLIGVNNRDLRTLNVSLDVSRRLAKSKPNDCLLISESGLGSKKDIDELRRLGFDGFLIGETLMRSENSAAELSGWI